VLALPDPVLRFKARRSPVVRRAVPFLFPFRQNDLIALARRLRAVAPGHFPPGRAWRMFRHTLAWELLAAGATRDYVREVLGHDSLASSDHYCRRLMGTQIDPGPLLALDPGLRHNESTKTR
jgi:integrase